MNKVFIFMLGAAAGSLLTWKLIEKKYKDIADEEIESMSEYYKNKYEKEEAVEPHKTRVLETDSIEPYIKKVSDLGYTNEEDEIECSTKPTREIFVTPGVDHVEPYVISPDEYGEVDCYETKQWTLYADGIVTDEDDQIIGDYENYIGDALEHFGEFADNSVFVRNENTDCDYEILRYNKTFDELNPREDN